MTPQRLVVAALLLSALAVPRAQAASCTHLLTDAVGDAHLMGNATAPSQVDDSKQVDLVWVELRSTKTTLTATVKLVDLNPESKPPVDHDYTVGFTNGGQRFQLDAAFNHTGDFAWVTHGVGSEGAGGAGASAYEVIADASATLDPHKDTLTISAPLSVFNPVHPLAGSLTTVDALTYTGSGAKVAYAYGSDDEGDTTRAYRMGTVACLR